MYFIYMTYELMIDSEMIILYMLSKECVVCSGFKVQTVTEGGWNIEGRVQSISSEARKATT